MTYLGAFCGIDHVGRHPAEYANCPAGTDRGEVRAVDDGVRAGERGVKTDT